ncbi:MAG: bifunctional glutamate N-acetyltransferase/amino-acid acetyltransferase ArgJ [Candidatus Merdivicinus sp.]|jgi:glutamate N-acetyltransferase/amino-acid N-acetyltransferase
MKLVQFEGFSFVEGGVTAAKGFSASGLHCGIRANKSKKDLGMVLADHPCTAAGVYTLNKVKGAPIAVTKAHIADGYCRGIIVNSGIANTCNADGIEKAEAMCKIAAQATGLSETDFAVASTGVIGQPLPLEPIQANIAALVKGLSPENHADFASAIMTTDTVMKEVAVEFSLGGKTCHIGGCAKGSGMIMPNMATMLCFLTTDAAISPDILPLVLKQVVDETFNMVSVDGDTSTNDTVLLLASGEAGNPEIKLQEDDFRTFADALYVVLMNLSRMIAGDGEGATKLLECTVTGAYSKEQAKIVAKSVINSSLLKAAMFGADANWGRVLCAIGYADTDVDVNLVDVTFASENGVIDVCKKGSGIDFSEEIAKKVLTSKEVKILVNLNDGEQTATAWGCDLTYDYVRINGDYRS